MRQIDITGADYVRWTTMLAKLHTEGIHGVFIFLQREATHALKLAMSKTG